MSIKYTDGQLLIHCFAGCSAGEVVKSVGMRISELFDRQLDSAPAARQFRNHTNAREILESILIPIRVVMMAVAIQDKRALASDELQSFQKASITINRALDTAILQGVLNAS